MNEPHVEEIEEEDNSPTKPLDFNDRRKVDWRILEDMGYDYE